MMKMNDRELRELDAWVAEHVMGWTDLELYQPPSEFMEEQQPPFFRGMNKMCLLWQSIPNCSTDPAAAMQVLEKCTKNCSKDCKTISVRENGEGYMVFARDSYYREVAEAETLPLAICLFAKQLFSK